MPAESAELDAEFSVEDKPCQTKTLLNEIDLRKQDWFKKDRD